MTASLEAQSRRIQLVNLCKELVRDRPLILISNRGPVEHQMATDGQIHPRRGAGGVVTALNSLTQNVEFTWIASAMGEGDRKVTEASENASIRSAIPGHQMNLRYVVAPRRVYHKYYNVFCNPLLWFLQHCMWSSPYTPNVDAAVHDAWENGYVAVNKAFADSAILEAQTHGSPPNIIVHDYHLYLVPMYVRQAVPGPTLCTKVLDRRNEHSRIAPSSW